MKDVGIVGVPYSGKTTLFTALTRSGGAGGRANQAVVDVPDERLTVLAEMESSKRVVPAKIRFVDVPGGLTAKGLGDYRQTDVLCIVVRAFGPEPEPGAELESVRSELILADLASIEGSLEKARKRARGSREASSEVAALEHAHALLEEERLLRDGDLDAQEAKELRGYGLLTVKPTVVVANVDEGAVVPNDLPDDALSVSAALEAEVAGMDATEAAELLAGFGIKEPGLNRVIAACYRALDLVTFLTATEEEAHAWEIPRGAKAPEAAGTVHSDMERGFIRAEVISFNDLVSAGAWEQAKATGQVRVEGKDYVVQEGDVLYIRFAV
jgi:GTP-binding protein YchF